MMGGRGEPQMHLYVLLYLPDVHKCNFLLFYCFRPVWKIRREQKRSSICPLVLGSFIGFNWQLARARFQSFSGTSAAQNNGVLRAVYVSEARELGPGHYSPEKDWRPLLRYRRADKGGRCVEEMNVNPSVFY